MKAQFKKLVAISILLIAMGSVPIQPFTQIFEKTSFLAKAASDQSPESQNTNPVATVGDKKFDSLKAAIDEANNNELITLYADVNEPKVNLGIDQTWGCYMKNIIIDLNGHTATFGTFATNYSLTIKNGTLNCIINNNSNYYATLTLDNAVLNTPEAEDEYSQGISWAADHIEIKNGSTMVLNGNAYFNGWYSDPFDFSIDETSFVIMNNVLLSGNDEETVLAELSEYLPTGYYFGKLEDEYSYRIFNADGDVIKDPVTLSAIQGLPATQITYVTANGQASKKNTAILLDENTVINEKFLSHRVYYVTGNVDLKKFMFFNKDGVTLILADDATLKSTYGKEDLTEESKTCDITITKPVDANGTGKFISSGEIFCSNYTQYAGQVEGVVKATGKTSGKNDGTITLDFADANTKANIVTYNENEYTCGSVVIPEGKALTDGQKIYLGSITGDVLKEISGKTLKLAQPIIINTIDNNGNSTQTTVYAETYTSADYTIPSAPKKEGYEFSGWTVNDTLYKTVEAAQKAVDDIVAARSETAINVTVVYKEQENQEDPNKQQKENQEKPNNQQQNNQNNQQKQETQDTKTNGNNSQKNDASQIISAEPTVTVTVTLAAPKNLKLTKGKKSFKATWKKLDGVDGYELQYSLKKNFKSASKKNLSANKNVATVSKLKSHKKYYVRMRAYKNVDDKTVYSKWCNKKTVKVK